MRPQSSALIELSRLRIIVLTINIQMHEKT